MTSEAPAVGMTVKDVSRLFRVSPDKVRSWIKAGDLPAVNTSDAACRKPRFVVLPHQLAEFEQKRRITTPPKKTPRRKKRSYEIDFYP